MKIALEKFFSRLLTLINAWLILDAALMCYPMRIKGRFERHKWFFTHIWNLPKTFFFVIIFLELLLFIYLCRNFVIKVPLFFLCLFIPLRVFSFLFYAVKALMFTVAPASDLAVYFVWIILMYFAVGSLDFLLMSASFLTIQEKARIKKIEKEKRLTQQSLEEEYHNLEPYPSAQLSFSNYNTDNQISEHKIRNILDSISDNDLTEELKDMIVNSILHETADKFELSNTAMYFYYKTMFTIITGDADLHRNHGEWAFSFSDKVPPDFMETFNTLENLSTINDAIHEKLLNDVNHAVNEVFVNQIDRQRIRVNQNMNKFFAAWKGIKNGYEGEKKLESELDKYNSIIGLKNIRILSPNGESAECDYIAITQYGIYIIEVKNLGQSGNFKLRIERDGRWSKVYNNGYEESMDNEFHINPIRQNEYHIRIVEEYLNKKLHRSLDDSYHIKSIIALANMNVQIQNESVHRVLRVEDVMSNIRLDNIFLKESEMKIIADALLAGNHPPKQYAVMNANKLVYEYGHQVIAMAQEWDYHAGPLLQFAEKYISEMERLQNM